MKTARERALDALKAIWITDNMIEDTEDSYGEAIGKLAEHFTEAVADARRATLEKAVSVADYYRLNGCTPVTIVDAIRALLDDTRKASE